MSNRRSIDTFVSAAKRARKDEDSCDEEDEYDDLNAPVRSMTELFNAAAAAVSEKQADNIAHAVAASATRASSPPSYLESCQACNGAKKNFIFGTKLPRGALPGSASSYGCTSSDSMRRPVFGFACTEPSCKRIFCHECIIMNQASGVCDHSAMVVSQPAGAITQDVLLPAMMLAVIARVTQVKRGGSEVVLGTIGSIIKRVVDDIHDGNGGPMRVASQISSIREVLGKLFSKMHRKIPGFDPQRSTYIGAGLSLATTGHVVFDPATMFGPVSRVASRMPESVSELRKAIAVLATQVQSSKASSARVAAMLKPRLFDMESFLVRALVSEPDISTPIHLVESAAKLFRAELELPMNQIIRNSDGVLVSIITAFTESSVASSPCLLDAIRAMVYITTSSTGTLKHAKTVLDTLIDLYAESTLIT